GGHGERARERALGHAVGHVEARGRAPPGDYVAAVNDDAGLLAAVLDRADRLAERLASEGLVMVERQVARVARFARHREIDRALEQRRVDACFGGRLALPERVGIVDALRVYAERN